jgi:hypothetical protein
MQNSSTNTSKLNSETYQIDYTNDEVPGMQAGIIYAI